jgi:general secretion pathway protein K
MPRRPAPARDRGFALLLVLWVVAILSVVAAGFAAGTRSESRLARNLLAAAEARTLAEAGVARAGAALLESDPRRQWRANGEPHELALAGGIARVRIHDEAGKIDLNLAPPEVLSGLCQELRIDGAICAALLDGVGEKRRAATPAAGGSPPGVSRFNLNSAQPFGVGTQSLNQLQNAAFSAVDELGTLPGVDAATLERLRPFVTVYSQNPRIDPGVAPREVLLALPGVNPREVELLLEARAALDLNPLLPPTTLPQLSGVENYVANGQLRIATVLASGMTESGAVYTRRAIIAVTGVPIHPLQTLEWRQQLESEAEEDAASDQ